MKKTSLDKLENGQSCYVLEINTEEKIKYRLLDLGLVPYTKVQIIKRAPLGDPIQIFFRGYNLTIREDVAKKINVEVMK